MIVYSTRAKPSTKYASSAPGTAPAGQKPWSASSRGSERPFGASRRLRLASRSIPASPTSGGPSCRATRWRSSTSSCKATFTSSLWRTADVAKATGALGQNACVDLDQQRLDEPIDQRSSAHGGFHHGPLAFQNVERSAEPNLRGGRLEQALGGRRE